MSLHIKMHKMLPKYYMHVKFRARNSVTGPVIPLPDKKVVLLFIAMSKTVECFIFLLLVLSTIHDINWVKKACLDSEFSAHLILLRKACPRSVIPLPEIGPCIIFPNETAR